MPKRSRMLVTTRKLDETDMLNKPDVITRVAYPINCLPPNEAKKLLSTKALGIPLGTFDASSDIDGLLSACGGIPLVLNLVGTRLCKHRNNLSAFNSTIETFRDSLEKGEDESTEKVVDVVFKSLPGDRYKDAFLDIAAFFSSCKKDIVRYIVREDELKALQEAALVKISDDNVELHDVVLNRGRKLSESDRITDLISLADIIEDTERLEKLKGIRLRGEFHLQAKHLDKMHNCLRVLILGQNEVTGACSREFKNLRYLSIDNENCCSPMELNKLPSLAIFKGRIRSDDCFCNAPPSLRSLTVYGLESVWLHGSFDKLSNLEELSICRKKNYVERLPESFGELRLLRCLHLHHFTELTSLPNTFGQLSKLEELTIRDCPKLSSLSDDFGHLKSLESLAIGFCQSLVKLSDTFAQLNNLKDLTIWDCSSLSSLPNKFGQLKSLQFLKIVHCKSLSSLCEDFGHLRSLKTLTIQKCESLERFNDTIGQLSSLKELIIEDCTMLCSLSDTFGQLNNLRKLIIEKCPMLSGLSDNFGHLKSLEILNIWYCQRLERLSDTFGQLCSLKELYIVTCPSLTSLCDDFGHLKSLEILNIWYCQRLERLSDTFGQLCSLKELYIVNYPSLTSLCDDFGQLKSLQYLRIKDCRSLERLSDTFGQLSNLKELCIKDCESLSSLCDNFGQLSSLQELIISGCQRLERLSDDFGSLTCLTTIDASKCPVLEGKAVEQMTGLTSLMELDIRKSPLLIECWQKIEDGHPQNVLTGRKRDIMLKSNAVDINAARDEVIKLLALRNKSDTRAVVLFGVGGIGKTTLAIAVISSLKLDAYKYCRINIQWDNCLQSYYYYVEGQVSYLLRSSYYMSSPKPIFLFIDNFLSGRKLHKILPGNLSSLPKGSRMLITTRRLNETRVIKQRGIKRYPYKIDGLSEEGSEKLLCRKALGSADRCFNGSFDIDSLAKICGGIPPVLNMAGSKLRELGNDVSACDRTIEFLRDTLSKVEGNWREKVVDVLYHCLRENMYKDAVLDIAAFFNNWCERTVGYIVGEAALKAIEDAALVQISEQGKVIVDYNVQVRGRELSELEEGRITNTESLQSALKDTERLEKTQGICLLRKSSKGLLSFPRMSSFNDAEIHLQAAHLDKMHECLRVLILCKGTKVTGECAQKFDNLRYLKVNNGDCSPIELNKLPSLAIFEGRLRGDDRFCDLPHSLRRLKVDALESLGFDENFGKLSRLEELNLSQNEQHLTRLPQSFGQLDSLRYLKLSHFRELTSLPDTFGQLRNLEELHINDCTKLCSLSDNFGKLSKLNRLKIINCPNLLNLSDGFSQLTNLKNLVIVNCTNLASLSHSFGQLSNLKKLVIVNCTNLSTLCDNFGQLKSLEYLRIRGCRRLERLSEDFGSLPCVAAIDASGCAVLEGNTVNQMIELKSLKVLNICESQLLLKRWEEVKENHPLLVRTESERDIFFRNSMCRALFDAENRFLNVDGMVREWSPTFVEGESQGVAFLVSCCDLCSPSNKKACQMVLKKMAQFSSWVTSHIIYVGLTEQNGERTGETLRHLSQGINSGATLCAWIPSHYKWKELFGFSACMMLSSTWRLNTFVALGILSTSEQGNPRVQAIMQIIPRVEDEDSDEDMALNVPYMDTEEDEDEKVEDEDDEDGDDEIAMVDLGADFSSLYSHLHTSFAF